jgi:DNA-binding NarL/FixJ family response regulator
VNKPIRVLVANQPRLMRELIAMTIADSSDIEVVGEVQNEADILDAIEKTRPDFLIVASDEAGRPPSICVSILETNGQIKILAITPNLDSGALYWATPFIHSSKIEASEEGVLRTLHGEVVLRVGGIQ